MANANDFLCDVTGEPIALSSPPIVVRIVAGLAPGAAPIDLATAPLSPFLRNLLALNVARLELAAATFDRLFAVDVEGMGPAFTPGNPSLVGEVARLREENARYRAAHGEPPA